MGELKDKHYCKVAKTKLGKKAFEEYCESVSQPKHVCESCLRTASRKKNLCKPVKLKHSQKTR